MEGLLCVPMLRCSGSQLTWGMQWEMWTELGMEKRLETRLETGHEKEAGCQDGFTVRDGELARIGVVDRVREGRTDVDAMGDREWSW